MSTGVTLCLVPLSFAKINCHERPYRSCIHPYLLLNGYSPSCMSTVPSLDTFRHSSLTSSFVPQKITWSGWIELEKRAGADGHDVLPRQFKGHNIYRSRRGVVKGCCVLNL